MPRRLFDSHCHIIDHRFPIVANQGYTPPHFPLEDYLAQARKQLFLRALAACKGNQAEAAAMLGVSKQAVNKFVAGQSSNAS